MFWSSNVWIFYCYSIWLEIYQILQKAIRFVSMLKVSKSKKYEQRYNNFTCKWAFKIILKLFEISFFSNAAMQPMAVNWVTVLLTSKNQWLSRVCLERFIFMREKIFDSSQHNGGKNFVRRCLLCYFFEKKIGLNALQTLQCCYSASESYRKYLFTVKTIKITESM